MLSKREYVLERSKFIPLPRDQVFAFFSDAGNLEAITPDSLNFEILTPTPIDMRPGALIDYQLRFFGVPLRWRTRIDQFEPPVCFVDTQLRGPYRKWVHTHTFEEVEGGTRMHDHVEYALPLGPLGTIARWLFVRRNLEQIFDFRNERIELLLLKDPANAESVGA